MLTGPRLVLLPGLGDKPAKMGDLIKIIRPDKTVIEASIKGIGFNKFRDISVGKGFTKDDIPEGSEIWLIEK